MANRSAKFASAIIASLLVGGPITIFTSAHAHAAHHCLTKPGSETRQGQQWRYRTERGTKRRCWLLIAMSGSITNAHDELPLPAVANMPSATDSVTPVAPRWSEPSTVNSSIGPAPEASATIAADANPTPQADPSLALATETLAGTPATTEKTANSFQMLLLVILGTLALASLTEELIEQFLVRLSQLRQSDMERLLLR